LEHASIFKLLDREDVESWIEIQQVMLKTAKFELMMIGADFQTTIRIPKSKLDPEGNTGLF
jgi:hypothetical protein